MPNNNNIDLIINDETCATMDESTTTITITKITITKNG